MAPATKPYDLSSIPRHHLVEGKNVLLHVVLCVTQTQTQTRTQVQNVVKKKKLLILGNLIRKLLSANQEVNI